MDNLSFILCIGKESPPSWWDQLYEIVDFIGVFIGAIVGLIAIITFVGTYFFRTIKIVGWSYGNNIYSGYRFGLILQNRCLSALSIRRISIILDDEEEVIVFSSNPLASQDDISNIEITPFQVKTICSPNSTKQLFEKGSLEKYKKIVFCFTHSDEKQTKVRYRLKKIKKNQRKVFVPRQEKLRGISLSDHMRYIVEERNGTEILKQYVVFGNGLINEKIHNVSKIPEEHLNSEGTLKAFLESNVKGATFDVYYNKHFKGD